MTTSGEKKEKEEKGENDLELPRAVVHRLIKYSLPDNIHVQQEAKLAIAHAGKVFINYLTAWYVTYFLPQILFLLPTCFSVLKKGRKKE